MNDDLLTSLALSLFSHLTREEQDEIILSLASAPSE